MENTNSGFTLLELFLMGGVFMWPLLLFSIVTVAITLERVVYLFYHNLRLDDLREKTELAIRDGGAGKIKEYLESQTRRRMGARVLLALVNNAGLSEHRVEKAAEAEAMRCITSLESGFNFLTALGSLAPLTGFLGTVSGMIGAFKSIAEAPDVNARIVANGIYEALITTVFGLIIAIIAMSAHSVFAHIVDKFASDVEIACSDIINKMSVNKMIARETGGPSENTGQKTKEVSAHEA